MEIALARVDDRLIHGQVVTAWLRQIGRCDEIIVCDDRVSRDPLTRQVIQMAKPPGLSVRVLSVEETLAEWEASRGDDRRVMLLTRGPGPMRQLLERGVAFDRLNLGGMAGGPNRRKLHNSVFVDDSELADLHQIMALGVPIDIRMVPTDPGIDFSRVDPG